MTVKKKKKNQIAVTRQNGEFIDLNPTSFPVR